MRETILLLISVFFPVSAIASISANCGDPQGRVYGQHGAMFQFQRTDTDDSFTNQPVSLMWEPGRDTAEIQFQSQTHVAHLIYSSKEQLSFLVRYPAGPYMFSLFMLPQLLLISGHMNGILIDSGGAIAKTFMAECNVTIDDN